MALTDDQWNNVLALLNERAELDPADDGIGKLIDTPDEFVAMLREHWDDATRPNVVNGNGANARDFRRLEEQLAASERAVADLPDVIRDHPGNPNPGPRRL